MTNEDQFEEFSLTLSEGANPEQMEELLRGIAQWLLEAGRDFYEFVADETDGVFSVKEIVLGDVHNHVTKISFTSTTATLDMKPGEVVSEETPDA